MRTIVDSPTQPRTNAVAYPARFGFRSGDRGTHTSRTIMLRELTELLRTVPPRSAADQYRSAIIDDNILGKKTHATRRLTAQRLVELYGVDPKIPLFRILRQFWDSDRQGRSLLAFQLAYARDPLLRATADPVLSAPIGRPIQTTSITEYLAERLGPRLNDSVRAKVARNAASSWTQSGHLSGRTSKVRTHPVATTSAVTFALVLGYLAGNRGLALFKTEWTRLLDLTGTNLQSFVASAGRQGLLAIKQLGDVAEVRFPGILTAQEEEMCDVGT